MSHWVGSMCMLQLCRSRGVPGHFLTRKTESPRSYINFSIGSESVQKSVTMEVEQYNNGARSLRL